MSENKKEMILPEIKMGKASIRKTLLDDNGMTYEVEEEIEIPVFNNIEENNS